MSHPEEPTKPREDGEHPEWAQEPEWTDAGTTPGPDATQEWDAEAPAARDDDVDAGVEDFAADQPLEGDVLTEAPPADAAVGATAVDPADDDAVFLDSLVRTEGDVADASVPPADDVTGEPAVAEDAPVVAPLPGEGSGDGGATAAGATADDEAPRRRPLLVAGAVVLMLAVIAGIIWAVISTSETNRHNAIRDTATTYLTAVAGGDAEAALESLAERPVNTTLMTNDVLAASNAAAPLTDVQVTSVASEGRDATAQVSYRLGEQDVQTTLALTGDGRSDWKIADGTSELLINETRNLTVNGATLTEPANPVFPGTYTAASANQHVQLTGEGTATIPSPEVPSASLNVTQGLSEAGQQAVTAAVKARFDECLTSKESLPGNCPFGVNTEGVELGPEGVTYALTNDPWTGMVSELDAGAMSAGGTFHFEVTATATVTREGLTTTLTLPLAADRGYNVDLTKDPLAVTWW